MLKKLIALFRKNKRKSYKPAAPVPCVQMRLPLDF
jgi:hypothetical protein